MGFGAAGECGDVAFALLFVLINDSPSTTARNLKKLDLDRLGPFSLFIAVPFWDSKRNV